MVYVLFQGEYNKNYTNRIIGIFSSFEGAKTRASYVVAEESSLGFGPCHYAEGPGISYPSDSGILFRGQQENPYCIWVKKIPLDA